MNNEQSVLLELIKIGFGKGSIYKKPQGLDWQELFDLAERHQVTAIALDGINRCFEKGIELGIDFQTKMDCMRMSCWRGLVMKYYRLNLRTRKTGVYCVL